MQQTFLFTAWLIYLFFGQPFRDLDLAVAFQKLESKINATRGIRDVDCDARTNKYLRNVGCCFYLKLFIYKRLPRKIQK